MTNKLRITLAQLNLIVGDIQGNLKKLMHAAFMARDEQGADVIVFPELSFTGYPPEDLLLRPAFLNEVNSALQQFVAEVQGIYCVIGHPEATENALYNACSLVYNGKILGTYAKQYLPNYGVFDECRYFTPGKNPSPLFIKNIPIGLAICEDLWHDQTLIQLKAMGARLILAPNASPFESDKHETRFHLLAQHAKRHELPIVYVNLIGGQDELIFDGGSMVVNTQGEIAGFCDFFIENLVSVDVLLTATSVSLPPSPIHVPALDERIYQALVLSVRDYIQKNNISGVLIGVSGGIDSALTLAIAVDALGKDRVKAIMMPSRHTSELSLQEAKKITQNLDVEELTIPIDVYYQAFLDNFASGIPEAKLGLMAQNLQARCRGTLLMALSNSSQFLVLNTGNRSEIAVGYCTLYGDMVGGFAVLKDVPKTLVYELAHYRNRVSFVIPEDTLTRAPTAELAPGQRDDDDLPPYSILDPILFAYLNQGRSIEEIIAQGFNAAVVNKVVGLIHKNEYKRRQSVLGPHINHKSFGKDWRYPLCNGYKG